METPAGRKIRIGEAAAAIGATPKALRHWISRYSDKGVKPTTEQSGTWLEFSWGDVAALAVTKYLVDTGMSAYAAFAVGMKIVEEQWPGLFNVDEPRWSKSPDDAIVWVSVERNGGRTFGNLTAGGMSVDTESRALIMLSVGAIVVDAFAALADMGHQKPVCDDSKLSEFMAKQRQAEQREADEAKRFAARIEAAIEKESNK